MTPSDRQLDLRRHLWPLVTAVVGSLVYLLWRPPTADLSNQYFRSAIFGQEPWAVWNNRWFGGHHTPGYSLLSPPLGWLIGPLALGVLSVVAGALAASLLTHRLVAANPTLRWPVAAAVTLTIGLLSSLYGGRTAFLLGAAFGLSAMITLVDGRPWATGVLAVLSTAGSPVTGLFLGLIGIAVWLGARGGATGADDARARRHAAAALAVPPIVLIVVLGIAFPDPGTFPFPVGGMVNTLLATAVVAYAGWQFVTMRWACLGYAVLCLGVTVVPTPIGGNAARLAALCAPAAVVLLPLGGRALTVAVVALFTVLQWTPVSLAVTGDREQTEASFYDPVLEVLDAAEGPLRVEVVPVASHDEANVIGQHYALARGWNRQLDHHHHELFYEDHLDADAYFDWLVDNGVSYVAIADTQLDHGGELEKELLRDPPDYLLPVLDDGTWRVFEVVPRPSLTGEGASLTDLGNDSFQLDVTQPGPIEVKVRFSPWFRTTSGDACAREGDDGWTVVEAAAPGPVTVEAQLTLSALLDRNGDC